MTRTRLRKASATAIAGMIVVFVFSGAPAPRAEDPISHWKEALAGAKLERRSHASSSTGAGSTITTSWDLCRGGIFHSSSTTTASVEVSGSVSLSTNQVTHTGRWLVEMQGQEAFLVLIHRDGRQNTYHLTSDDQTTYLEGERVSQTRSSVCP